MTKNIQSIFDQNIVLLGLIDKAILDFREGEYESALSIIADSITSIRTMTDAVIVDREYFNLVSTESVLEMLSGIVAAQKIGDYVLLADLLELQLIAFICNVQELIMNKEDFYAFSPRKYNESIELLIRHLEKVISLNTELDVNDKLALISGIRKETSIGLNSEFLLERGYRVEFTSCGMMTLGVTDASGRSYYMHSNNMIIKEAYLTAKKWYNENINQYIVYGFGMGYVIKELLKLLTSTDKQIAVYEADINILKLACAFSDVNDLLIHPQVTLYFDPDYKMLKKRFDNIDQTDKVCVFYPALRGVQDSEAKEMLMDYLPWARKLEEM